MSDQPSTSVDTLFSAYVRLRQCGLPIGEAARELKASVEGLAKTELDQLAMLTQGWEANHNRPSSQTTHPLRGRIINAGTVTLRESPPSKPAIRPIQRSHDRRSTEESTAIMSTSSSEAPSPVIRPITVKKPANYELAPCPNCSKLNRVGESYCYACGEVLIEDRVSTRRLEDTASNRRKLGASYFGPETTLVLHIRNTGDSIQIIPGTHEIVLGRSTNKGALNPDIDLNPFGADTLGVSRLHVSLKRSEHTMMITDMNSSNKTYVNGQVLHPHEVRALNDGDEIRIGRMYIAVQFSHLS
ncbi:MAG: FHA domain-containing protein [Anaerolineae bacterium]